MVHKYLYIYFIVGSAMVVLLMYSLCLHRLHASTQRPVKIITRSQHSLLNAHSLGCPAVNQRRKWESRHQIQQRWNNTRVIVYGLLFVLEMFTQVYVMLNYQVVFRAILCMLSLCRCTLKMWKFQWRTSLEVRTIKRFVHCLICLYCRIWWWVQSGYEHPQCWTIWHGCCDVWCDETPDNSNGTGLIKTC